MLVVWSGWGILAVPVVVGTALVVGGVLQWGLGAAGRPDLAFLAISAGLFAAAGANWMLGRRLNTAPGRELVDPATGARVVVRRRHTLFWVGMEWWSVPVALAGVAALLPLLRLAGVLGR